MFNLIISLILIHSSQIPSPDPRIGYQDYLYVYGVPLKHAAAFNATAVVKSLGIHNTTLTKDARYSEEVVVLSSPYFPQGKHLITMTPMSRIPLDIPHYQMRKGQNYLLIGVQARNGYFPQFARNLAPTSTGKLFSNPGSLKLNEDEVEAINVFHTNDTSMDLSATPANQLLESLVDCLAGASNDEATRASLFVDRMNPDPITIDSMGLHKVTPLTEKIQLIADNSPVYQRALLYWILADWQIKGIQEPFVHALLSAANDPTAFTDPRNELAPRINFQEAPEQDFRPDGNTLFSAVSTSNSTLLIGYLMTFVQFTTPPDKTHIQALAQHLETAQSEPLQSYICNLLGTVNKGDSIYPIWVYDTISHVRKWTNKVQCLKFWKDAAEGN